ncbi:MAG: hypothetical protein ABIB61_04045 [Candidatus Shapirobacteria bacterium]
MKLIPTILTSFEADLEKKLNFLAGKTDWVQIDVVDSSFAKERTFPLGWLDNYQDKEFFWDMHLMVRNPFSWVERCSSIMAQRVIGQIEQMEDQVGFLERVEQEGMDSGLALDLMTPVANLDPDALLATNLVLILAAKAGKSGQKFEEASLAKIQELREIREKLECGFLIGVDCGVNKENIDLIKESGVDLAYVGTAFWEGRISLE